MSIFYCYRKNSIGVWTPVIERGVKPVEFPLSPTLIGVASRDWLRHAMG